MEIIETLAKLVGVLLFYGFMIVVGIMSAIILATFGFGLLAVYVLQRLQASVVAPVEDSQGNPLDYHIIDAQANLLGVSYFAHIWYVVDVHNQFAGIQHVILADGRDVKNELDPAELDRLLDIAEHAWETAIGQP